MIENLYKNVLNYILYQACSIEMTNIVFFCAVSVYMLLVFCSGNRWYSSQFGGSYSTFASGMLPDYTSQSVCLCFHLKEDATFCTCKFDVILFYVLGVFLGKCRRNNILNHKISFGFKFFFTWVCIYNADSVSASF